MKTCVYVDGFNLYYGALKNTKYKWLNIAQLCRQLLPKHNVIAIKYFTAMVHTRSDDPSQPLRQQLYLRALRTLPEISISEGLFLTHPVWMRLVNPPPNGSPYVRVIDTKEKGSDVNLATHLLHDAHQNRFEAAIVITGDSDLAEPVKIITQELKKIVGVINPRKNRPCRALIKYSTFYKEIREGVLASSQFSDVLSDSHGKFHKPAGW